MGKKRKKHRKHKKTKKYKRAKEIKMAVTWDFSGIITKAKAKEISVSATRTDSESSDPPVIVNLPKISVRTNTHKLRALDKIYAMGNVELQRRVDDAEFQTEVDALELQAKNNLEARDN